MGDDVDGSHWSRWRGGRRARRSAQSLFRHTAREDRETARGDRQGSGFPAGDGFHRFLHQALRALYQGVAGQHHDLAGDLWHAGVAAIRELREGYRRLAPHGIHCARDRRGADPGEELKGIDAGTRFLGSLGKYPQLAAKLKSLGRAAVIAGVVVAVIEAGNHFRKGDIGPGMAEIYGLVMGIAVPWAALIDAAQSLLFAYFPDLEGSYKVRYALRFLNAINPIGAGNTAIDSGYTMVKMVGQRIATGEWNMRELDYLVNRMENSPMRLFTEAGEFWGDVLGDLTGDWFYEMFLK